MTTMTMTTTTTMSTTTTVAGTTEKDWVKAFWMNIGLNQGEHVLLPLKQHSKRKPKMIASSEGGEDDENLALENWWGGVGGIGGNEIEDEAEERRRSSIDCRLCSICKDPDDQKHYKTTTYGCAPCKSAYHPECFLLVHHEQAFNVNHEIFQRFSCMLAQSKVDGSEKRFGDASNQ